MISTIQPFKRINRIKGPTQHVNQSKKTKNTGAQIHAHQHSMDYRLIGARLRSPVSDSIRTDRLRLLLEVWSQQLELGHDEGV